MVVIAKEGDSDLLASVKLENEATQILRRYSKGLSFENSQRDALHYAEIMQKLYIWEAGFHLPKDVTYKSLINRAETWENSRNIAVKEHDYTFLKIALVRQAFVLGKGDVNADGAWFLGASL